jgi:coenzyme F420-reducing hydrogenase alpha subunit
MAKTKGHENLIPQSERTKEQQREIARMGGIASGKARKEKRMLKDLLEEALSKGTETNNEYVNITKALIKEANKGNVKAYEVIRDTLGQKPKEVIEVSKTTDETILEVEKYLNSKKEVDSNE